jgi:UDP-glucose 6-dehydrogenase
MDTASAIVAMLKELGTPAITVIGFGWVLFSLKALKADVSVLKADVSVLKVDVKSIKSNHLPHIEAAIKELAKGTPNEEHVKAILDLSHTVEVI